MRAAACGVLIGGHAVVDVSESREDKSAIYPAYCRYYRCMRVDIDLEKCKLPTIPLSAFITEVVIMLR
jgi:hypothetical protein